MTAQPKREGDTEEDVLAEEERVKQGDLSKISPLIHSLHHLCTISWLSFPFFAFFGHIMKSIFFERMIMMPIKV